MSLSDPTYAPHVLVCVRVRGAFPPPPKKKFTMESGSARIVSVAIFRDFLAALLSI